MTENLEQILKNIFSIHVWESKYRTDKEFVTVVNYTSEDNIVEYVGYQTYDPFNPYEFRDTCSVFEFRNKYFPVVRIEDKI